MSAPYHNPSLHLRKPFQCPNINIQHLPAIHGAIFTVSDHLQRNRSKKNQNNTNIVNDWEWIVKVYNMMRHVLGIKWGICIKQHTNWKRYAKYNWYNQCIISIICRLKLYWYINFPPAAGGKIHYQAVLCKGRTFVFSIEWSIELFSAWNEESI